MENEPVEVWPLASYIAEEMEARGWTAGDVAARMGDGHGSVSENLLTVQMLLAVQEDDLLIGEDTMAALARAFDVSPEFFRNLDDTWRAWPDRRAAFDAPDRLLEP